MPKERPQVTVGLITPSGGSGSLAGRRKLRFGTSVLSKARPRPSDDNEEPSAFDKKKGAGPKRRGEHAGSAAGDVGSSGMVFNKGFGQHILRNPLVIAAIVEKAAVRPTDVVVEIGPGTGNLTEKLLMAAKKVIVYEVDPRMVSELHKRFQNSPLRSKLEIIRGNCLDHDFPHFDRCVANVPYAISSALVFKLLAKPTFKCAVLMFQREFALRVCAPPGSELYCRLSVNSQLLARCSHLMKVSKNSFTPPPKVESSVIRLDPKHPPPPVDFNEWDGLVKLLFNRKNKKAGSIFRTKTCIEGLKRIHESYCKMEGVSPMTPDAFKQTLSSLLEEPLLEGRGRSMNEEDIMTLLSHFNSKGIHFA
jgi:18S rRNA (adenine1779-N6/adenine1780-N6)-dimethyltransferase